MSKNKMTFDCEIHGEVKATVIQILNDKVNGTITMCLVCSICDKVKKERKEHNGKKP